MVITIYKIREKGKGELIKQIFVPLLIILTGSGGYAGWKLYTLYSDRVPVTIGYTELPTSTPVTISEPDRSIDILTATSSGTYVASRTGKNYYFPWCATAKRIANKNKVWFNSKDEAEKAGYTPSKTCKGLIPKENQ